MEKNTQMRIGGGILALMLAVLGGMYFFKGNEADAIREAAAVVDGTKPTVHSANIAAPEQSGNIPGTNVNQIVTSDVTTSIKFDVEKYDFGTVDEGTVVKHSYKFKNTGTEDLVIANAKASCGCTVPHWPKEPVKPGETGTIDVEFNTAGKPGNQTKVVTVTANTTPTNIGLQIGGVVRGKEQPAAKGGH